MKRFFCFILTLVILTAGLVLPVSANTYFTDVQEDDWFYTPVYKVLELGYMKGTSSNTFSPYESLTRAMAVQVLYNLSGGDVEYAPYFKDVAENSWFAKAVTWAKDKGVTTGVTEDSFSPDAKMTREQFACFFTRYAEVCGLELAERTPVEYTDAALISPWAKESVEVMNNAGIITSRPADTFLPSGSVARSELAAALLRLTGDYENGVYDSSVHVAAIYARVSSAVLEAGQSIDLGAETWPADAEDRKVVYASSDANVAAVDDSGRIHAVSKGVADITAVSRDDGHSVVCRITVNPRRSDPVYNTAKQITYTSRYSLELKPLGRSIDPNRPMVALTYDDGPRPRSTNAILDVLERYDAVATFFELGQLAAAYPECIAREVDLGCEVANHSYSHPMLSGLSAGGVANELSATNNAIYNACGVTPTLLRPPYGAYNRTVQNNAGMPLILWSIDTLDWKYRNASYVTSVIKNNVTDGSVVLMHSIYDSTAEATAIIVPWLINRGYQLVTVSELAEARGISMQNGAVYASFYK